MHLKTAVGMILHVDLNEAGRHDTEKEYACGNTRELLDPGDRYTHGGEHVVNEGDSHHQVSSSSSLSRRVEEFSIRSTWSNPDCNKYLSPRFSLSCCDGRTQVIPYGTVGSSVWCSIAYGISLAAASLRSTCGSCLL